ncbi:MAG: hypothetical protein OXU69_06785 [Gemmatimonadota bacterium]|nr:hypothetical protein [Gemmatimonadota bacterium]MDE2984394.1 hypothetical protein [Gemmatimonadota bacterium]
MTQLTECVVDILRRHGPGVLPARELAAELLRRRPVIALNADKLRRLVEQSGNRLRLFEVALDTLDDGRDPVPVESWVVLTAASDAPDSSILTASLWHSLSALALDIDPESRVQVCRWVIGAEEARRLAGP